MISNCGSEESVGGDLPVRQGTNREAIIKEPRAEGSGLHNADKLTADKLANKLLTSQ